MTPWQGRQGDGGDKGTWTPGAVAEARPIFEVSHVGVCSFRAVLQSVYPAQVQRELGHRAEGVCVCATILVFASIDMSLIAHAATGLNLSPAATCAVQHTLRPTY